MITVRIAHILGLEINGTPWERACLAKGKDPLDATADDIIGPMRGDMWDAAGKRVLSFDDEAYMEVMEELIPEDATSYHMDPVDFTREVADIATLTKQEAKIVGAIVDGSPIPDGKNYTGPLTQRLRTTPAAIWKAWSRAKTKLKNEWVA